MHPDKANATQFSFAVAGNTMKVVDFIATEKISEPYNVELTLGFEDTLEFDDIIGQEGLLTIYHDRKESDRFFHGIVSKFSQTGRFGDFYMYKATLVPSMHYLKIKQNSRIFQNQSVQDIVKQIFSEANIADDTVVFNCPNSDPMEFCVQYRETDFDFVSRLLEEEGLYYIFEHTDIQHKIIFKAGDYAHAHIKGEFSIPFDINGATVENPEIVSSFTLSKQIRPGKITLDDFNFEKPTALDLTSEYEDNTDSSLEIYDYPGGYQRKFHGSKMAKVRLEQMAMFREKGEGQSTCPRFSPGYTFNLTRHQDIANFEKEYLFVRVTHIGRQPQIFAAYESGAGFSYANQFVCIPSNVVLRPEFRTPKPVVHGVQTAIVTGPSGEEIYTDKHGRVKVQFHWDREGQNNEQSSCWIRVSQNWAGAKWGSMHIPRIGQEVIVDFIEGDPDRPIITGRVYHGENVPPYPLPANKTVSTVKSNSTPGGEGSNELKFEDKKGEEEVYLHAQKDWTIGVENDKNQTVGHDETLDVGNNRTKTVKINQSETIGENKTIEVGKNHTEIIKQNKTLTVEKNHDETINENKTMSVAKNHTESIGENAEISVGKNLTQSVGKDQTEDIGDNLSVSIGKSASEQVGGSKSIDIGKNFNIHASELIDVTGDKKVVITSGGSVVTIDQSGKVMIEADKIMAKASGDIILKGANVHAN